MIQLNIVLSTTGICHTSSKNSNCEIMYRYPKLKVLHEKDVGAASLETKIQNFNIQSYEISPNFPNDKFAVRDIHVLMGASVLSVAFLFNFYPVEEIIAALV